MFINVDLPHPFNPLNINTLGNFFKEYRLDKKLKSFSKPYRFKEFLAQSTDKRPSNDTRKAE